MEQTAKLSVVLPLTTPAAASLEAHAAVAKRIRAGAALARASARPSFASPRRAALAAPRPRRRAQRLQDRNMRSPAAGSVPGPRTIHADWSWKRPFYRESSGSDAGASKLANNVSQNA
eukprot:3343170-Pleurochrysis_carterae.AAC.3